MIVFILQHRDIFMEKRIMMQWEKSFLIQPETFTTTTLRENTAGGNTSIVKTFDNKYAIACSYQYPNLSYDVYFYKVNDSLEQDTVYPGNYTYDSLCPYQIQSGVIDLTGCTVITDIKDIPWKEDYNKSKDDLEIFVFPILQMTDRSQLNLKILYCIRISN